MVTGRVSGPAWSAVRMALTTVGAGVEVGDAVLTYLLPDRVSVHLAQAHVRAAVRNLTVTIGSRLV